MILNPNAKGSSGGGTPSYTTTFQTSDWISSGSNCSLTIPKSDHGLSGNLAEFQIFSKDSNGDYLTNSWAAIETQVSVNENEDVVLSYPNSTGYDGAAIISLVTLE